MSKEIEAPITINIGNVCDGAVVEAFELELRKCLVNIYDLSTSATASRTISLKVKLKPREDRVQIDVQFDCDSSLAPVISKTSRMFVGKDEGGQLYGLTADPRQLNIFTPPKPREAPPVIEFTASKG
jgi:hypothetical protein